MNEVGLDARAANLGRHVGGPLITAGAAIAIELLSRTAFRIPNPPAILILTVVFSAFSGGIRPGLISAVIAWLYFAYFFSTAGQPFHYTDENLLRVMVWMITTPAMALMVGLLKRRVERTSELATVNALLSKQIAERTQVEQALRESEQKFSILFEKAAFAASLSRLPDGVIADVNEAFERAFGYAKQEAVGKTSLELGINPDSEGRARILAALKEQGSVRNQELTLRIKSGEWRIMSVNIDLVDIGDQKYILNTTQDITERKRAEEKLRRQTRRLTALREIDTAILAADSVESIVGAALSHIRELIDCRRVTLSLYDWGANEALIFDVNTVNETSMPKGARVPLAPFQDMIQILSKDQPALINELTALPDPPPQIQSLIREGLRSLCRLPLFSQRNLIGVFDMSSEIPGFFDDEKIDLGREVANQVAIAIMQSNLLEALQHLNAELEQRVIERTAQLEVANRELESFSYSVSHDLRAPLRAIDGFSQALLEDYADRLDGEGKDHLRRVRAAAQRMAGLIDALLTLARVTRAEMRREPVDLSALARAIAAELQRQAPERQAEFVVADGLCVEGDSRLLQAALENLLGNAWKFTSKCRNARIEFGIARQLNGQRAYVVRDNGAGFDITYADKLFGAFQRLHAMSEFGGTGIGLATVQRIIHRHGGRVWAEGAVDQGAAFYFTLTPDT